MILAKRESIMEYFVLVGINFWDNTISVRATSIKNIVPDLTPSGQVQKKTWEYNSCSPQIPALAAFYRDKQGS